MSSHGPNWSIPGLKAGADLSAAANQYLFAKLDANGDVVLCDAAGEKSIGVLYNRPKSGEAADVRLGIVTVQADAALDEGAIIAVSADAQAKAAVAGKTDTSDAGGAADALIGSFAMGHTITAAGNAAEVITAFVMPMGAVPTTAA